MSDCILHPDVRTSVNGDAGHKESTFSREQKEQRFIFEVDACQLHMPDFRSYNKT